LRSAPIHKGILALFAAFSLTLSACAGSDDEGIGDGPPPTTYAFDAGRGKAEFEAGKAALGAGDHGRAAQAFEASLGHWPADVDAWAGLGRAYEAAGDGEGRNYALFFGERIQWANDLHPTTAATAFENIQLIDADTPFADKRVPETAKRLTAFYRGNQTRERAEQAAVFKKQETFGQRYLIYPVAVVSAGTLVYLLVSR